MDLTNREEVEQGQRRAAWRRSVGRSALYICALMFSLVSAGPFLWGLITAFKADRDLYNPDLNPFLFNFPPTLEHVRFLLLDTEFGTFALNTLIVGLLVVAITLMFSLPAAYSLARLRLRWSGALGIAIFCFCLVPPSLLFIPLSRVVAALGLQDSTWALVLFYPTITIPVSVWLLIGFTKSIPREIEEQAMIDGYSRVGAFARTALPLALPGIVAVAVFAFTLSTHEFVYALAFVATSSEKTVSVGIPTELIRGDVFFWQSLQAATVLVAVPIALVFNVFLGRFITGLEIGAVKR